MKIEYAVKNMNGLSVSEKQALIKLIEKQNLNSAEAEHFAKALKHIENHFNNERR